MLTRLLASVLLGLSLLGSPLLVFADEIAQESSTPPTAPVEEIGSPPSSAEDIAGPDAVAEIASTTSTSLNQEIVSTSTELAIQTSSIEEIIPSVSSTLTDTATTTAVHTPTTASSAEEMLVETSATPTLCLAIIAPAPLEGPEWIALYGVTPSTSAALIDWTLADAQGSLVKINASTTLLWDEASQTLRYELHSARLNNSGDTVNLKTPTSSVYDQFVYPSTERGQWWARDRCDQPWHRLPQPIEVLAPPNNDAEEDLFSEDEAVEPKQGPAIMEAALPELPPAPVIEIPASQSTPPVQERTTPTPTITFAKPPSSTIEDVAVPAATTSTKRSSTKTVITLEAAKTKAKATKASASTTTAKKPATKKTTATKKVTAAKTSTAKKPAVKKVTPVQLLPSFSPMTMQPELFEGIRVRVSGRVASKTGFLGANTYVLVNEDGRGILVKGTSKHPSPEFATTVDVFGTTVWNDSGLSLKQSTTDTWNLHTGNDASTIPTIAFPTRAVDLTAPSQEDAWSSIVVEGVVSSVQKASFDIDVQAASLHVRLVARLGYRAQRLQVGDTVRVAGLLDLRTDEPTLLPQTVESIEILKHPAPALTTDSKAPVNQPWLPVGAAAGTFALSEGWRRLKRLRQQRREEAAFQALLRKNEPSLS